MLEIDPKQSFSTPNSRPKKPSLNVLGDTSL